MSDQVPLLVDTGRGFSLRYKDKWLYSRYQPDRAAILACELAGRHEETLYILLSPCLWYGIDRLLDTIPESSTVIALEFDPALYELANSRNIGTKGQTRIPLLFAPDAGAVQQALSTRPDCKRLKAVVLSGGYELNQHRFDRLTSALALELATQSRNHLATMRMGRLWLKNSFGNLATLHEQALLGRFADSRPIFLAGAGPSLETCLSAVRACNERLHVMACDTAVGPLCAAGIHIDSVVCLEGQIHNLPDFIPLNGKPVQLFVDISAHPASFHAINGPKMVLASQWDSLALLRRLDHAGLPLLPVPPLGSVGVLALYLAIELSCAPLLVGGLDFSFPAGRTHARHSPAWFADLSLEQRLYKNRRFWKHSYQANTRECSPGYRDTSVLAMYAASARELVAMARERTPDRPLLDLRSGTVAQLGLDYPERSLPELLDGWDATNRWQTSSGKTEASDDRILAPNGLSVRERVGLFLRHELRLLAELRGFLRGDHAADKARLAELLADLDYLYAHFPDKTRVPQFQDDALRRVAQEAWYWESRIKRLLAQDPG